MKHSGKSATASLGTEKISTLLFRYALPSIIAMTAASLYNIIDSIFIGHGVGPLALSGLGITMPLMNVAAAFGSLVGVGAAAQLSIKLGQGDRESALRIVGNTVTLNVIIGLVFGGICLLFLEPIMRAFGASEATLPYATGYMRIILMGNIVTHLYLGLNNTLRAAGHPNLSMVAMIASVVGNCVLAAIFIMGFGWGVEGAAWATVIAQVIALAIQLRFFSDKRNEIHFVRSAFRLQKKIVNGIISIGLAPFLMNLTASAVVVFINNALRTSGGESGDLYIGAYGIVNRVALIFIMVVFGLNQGMQPIVGYNFGAKNHDRVRKALSLALKWAVGITTVGLLIGLFFPQTVARVFTTDPTLLAVTEEGLRIVMLVFPIVGFQIVISSFFQSIGNAKTAIILSLTRQLLFLIPLLVILPPIFGSKGVWFAMPSADMVSGILAFILISRFFSKFKRENTTLPDTQK